MKSCIAIVVALALLEPAHAQNADDPATELASFKLPDGFEANLFASEANGVINWWAARGSGIQFAYARATAGANARDAQFADNWKNIYAAGLARGAMHSFSPHHWGM